MADKKKKIALCAALAAVVILIILLLRGCGGTRVAEPTGPAQLSGETSAPLETTEAETTGAAEETEETTESTESTEETEPEATESTSSGGNSTPGGYNPDFGTDDDDDDDDKDEEKEVFAAPAAGVKNNPYVEYVKMEEESSTVSTVMIPLEGTVYYEIHGVADSMLLLEHQPNATVICGETTVTADEEGMITLPIGSDAEPVTIQLSNRGEAEAVYQLQFLPPVGSETNPEVLESIAEIPVALAAEDADGYCYIWTADQTGELTLTPQVPGYEIRVTIGETTITNADSGYGSLTFEIESGVDVTIQVIAIPDQLGAYPEVTDTILGEVADKGTNENPYVRYLSEIPGEITTVEIPAKGFKIYEIYGASETVLTISEPDATVYYNNAVYKADENGSLTLPFGGLDEETAVRLSIGCAGETPKCFTLKFAYPEGSAKNPIELATLDSMTVSLAGGEDSCRYYSWTAEETGTVVLQIEKKEPETAVCGISLTIGEAAGTEALEESASIQVEAGQTVLIRVETAAEEDGVYPAADITISGSFTLKQGTEENPIALTAEGATVSAAPGESLYCTVQAPGMELTLTGENVSVTYGETEYEAIGDRVTLRLGDEETAQLVITNKAGAEASYSLSLCYPLGSEENPAALALGENTLALEDGEAYCFSWTAQHSGELTLAAAQNADWAYTIENLTDADAEAVAGSELSQMMEVDAGDELRISIEAEGSLTFTASFYDPTLGTEENPILLEDLSCQITLAAGEAVYYRADVSGADMTVKGENVSVATGRERVTLEKGSMTLRCTAAEGGEVVFVITNTGEKEAAYQLSFAYPAGSARNPMALTLGGNTADVEAADSGCYFSWTADIDGELTLSAGEGTDWSYRIENLTHSGAAVSGSEVSQMVEVSAGDTLRIFIEAGDDVSFTASFFDPTLGTESNPIQLNVPEDTVTVPAGETKYYQARVGGMVLTLTGEKGSLRHDGEDYTSENGRIVLTCAESGIFALTNHGDGEAAYAFSFAWPEGHRENPIALELGDVTCTLKAGTGGCCYTWKAKADGTLTITMPEDAAWAVRIDDLTAETEGDVRTSGEDAPVLTVEVKAGQELLILVNTCDPSDCANAPAGTLEFTAAFEEAEA